MKSSVDFNSIVPSPGIGVHMLEHMCSFVSSVVAQSLHVEAFYCLIWASFSCISGFSALELGTICMRNMQSFEAP